MSKLLHVGGIMFALLAVTSVVLLSGTPVTRAQIPTPLPTAGLQAKYGAISWVEMRCQLLFGGPCIDLPSVDCPGGTDCIVHDRTVLVPMCWLDQPLGGVGHYVCYHTGMECAGRCMIGGDWCYTSLPSHCSSDAWYIWPW